MIGRKMPCGCYSVGGMLDECPEHGTPTAAPTDEEILRRFNRWQLKLTPEEAHTFWNDLDWLRKRCLGRR